MLSQNNASRVSVVLMWEAAICRNCTIFWVRLPSFATECEWYPHGGDDWGL